MSKAVYSRTEADRLELLKAIMYVASNNEQNSAMVQQGNNGFIDKINEIREIGERKSH